jgi:hypothetical protein
VREAAAAAVALDRDQLTGFLDAVLVAAPLLAAGGVPMTWCLLVVMLAPAVSVVGYESYGWRHASAALKRAIGAA